LFLDVDGVLNRVGGRVALEAVLLGRLKRILDETGCSIVLSSAWRTRSDLKVILLQTFSSIGIKPSQVVDQTEIFDPPNRNGGWTPNPFKSIESQLLELAATRVREIL
jgi:hypothetical protein